METSGTMCPFSDGSTGISTDCTVSCIWHGMSQISDLVSDSTSRHVCSMVASWEGKGNGKENEEKRKRKGGERRLGHKVVMATKSTEHSQKSQSIVKCLPNTIKPIVTDCIKCKKHDSNSQWQFPLQAQEQEQAQAQQASHPKILVGRWGCHSFPRYSKCSNHREVQIKKADHCEVHKWLCALFYQMILLVFKRLQQQFSQMSKCNKNYTDSVLHLILQKECILLLYFHETTCLFSLTVCPSQFILKTLCLLMQCKLQFTRFYEKFLK